MCDVAVERDAQLQSGAEPEQTSAAGSPPRGLMSPPRGLISPPKGLMSPPRGGLTLAATSSTDTARGSNGESMACKFSALKNFHLRHMCVIA